MGAGVRKKVVAAQMIVWAEQQTYCSKSLETAQAPVDARGVADCSTVVT